MSDNEPVITDEAVEAAAKAVYGHQMDEGVREATKARLRTALEAAAPYIRAQALEEVAEETRIRGDIGKDDGMEAWDFLNIQAKAMRRGTPVNTAIRGPHLRGGGLCLVRVLTRNYCSSWAI